MANPTFIKLVGKILRPGQRPESVELVVDSLDVAKIEASNTFTGETQTISATVAALALNASDAATDNKQWRLNNSGTALTLRPYSDADVAGDIAVRVDRTGSTVDSIALSATAIKGNGGGMLRYTSPLNASGGEITVSTLDPSGIPSDGDIWIKREA